MGAMICPACQAQMDDRDDNYAMLEVPGMVTEWRDFYQARGRRDPIQLAVCLRCGNVRGIHWLIQAGG